MAFDFGGNSSSPQAQDPFRNSSLPNTFGNSSMSQSGAYGTGLQGGNGGGFNQLPVMNSQAVPPVSYTAQGQNVFGAQGGRGAQRKPTRSVDIPWKPILIVLFLSGAVAVAYIFRAEILSFLTNLVTFLATVLILLLILFLLIKLIFSRK